MQMLNRRNTDAHACCASRAGCSGGELDGEALGAIAKAGQCRVAGSEFRAKVRAVGIGPPSARSTSPVRNPSRFATGSNAASRTHRPVVAVACSTSGGARRIASPAAAPVGGVLIQGMHVLALSAHLRDVRPPPQGAVFAGLCLVTCGVPLLTRRAQVRGTSRMSLCQAARK
jgi:hypothetical protein